MARAYLRRPMLKIFVCHELGPKTLSAIDQLTDAIKALVQKEEIMAKSITDLQADVQAETTAEQSAITLLTGLSQQIAALKSTQTDPSTASAIDALAQQVESNTSTLAAAVAANTPAADPASA